MTPPPVVVIDFLPEKYRQATRRRRMSYWRAIVVVLFGGVFAASAGGVVIARREVRREHDLVAARFAAATVHDGVVKAKAAQLAELREYADLVTFLRHPWPRSRIVEQVFLGVPTNVNVDKLRIVSETRAGLPPFQSSTPAEAPAQSAATDLATLRTLVESQDVVVRLEGTTTDQAGLHAYLQSLADGGYFLRAEIEQIEALRESGGAKSRFTARIVVRSGWTLPGGPKLEEVPVPAAEGAGASDAPSEE